MLNNLFFRRGTRAILGLLLLSLTNTVVHAEALVGFDAVVALQGKHVKMKKGSKSVSYQFKSKFKLSRKQDGEDIAGRIVQGNGRNQLCFGYGDKAPTQCFQVELENNTLVLTERGGGKTIGRVEGKLAVRPEVTQAAQPAQDTFALMRDSVANMQIVEVFIRRGNKAFATAAAANVVNGADADRFAVVFEAEVQAASSRIIERLAASEAQKYSVEEIGEIHAVGRMPYFQAQMLAILRDQPPPSGIDISQADYALFDRVVGTKHFESFQQSVTSNGGNLDRDVTILVKRAMAKLNSQ